MPCYFRMWAIMAHYNILLSNSCSFMTSPCFCDTCSSIHLLKLIKLATLCFLLFSLVFNMPCDKHEKKMLGEFNSFSRPLLIMHLPESQHFQIVSKGFFIVSILKTFLLLTYVPKIH